MNLVYILGSGSVWGNNEIRYSLRSAEKHILDLEKVFIVGECPDWLKDVVHIPVEDPTPVPWKNAYHKVKTACEDKRIKEEFLLMNDDFFFFKDIKAEEYPYYYKSFLDKNKLQTFYFLQRFNKPTKNYQIHCPFRIDPNEFLRLPELLSSLRFFSYRSFYCNYYNKESKLRDDLLIWPSWSIEKIEDFIKSRIDCAIISDTARRQHFRDWIRKKFPEKSRFEI